MTSSFETAANQMIQVLVVLPAEARHRIRLEAAGKGCGLVYVPKTEVTAEQIARADVIIGNVPPALIRASDRLRLLQLFSSGSDAYTRPGILAPQTLLANAGGAYGQTVSEHALALMLALMKKLPLYRDAQRERRWTDRGPVTSPRGAVVAVIGLGDVGRSFARLVKALGAVVIGVKRSPGEKPDYVDALYTTDRLDEVLPLADVIFSALPASAETRGLYTAERFAAMKNSAFFINCGRGSAVAPAVLQTALERGEIAGAAIDVTDPEPLPPENPLWSIENLIITPHVAGGFHLAETLERVVDIACENLSAYVEGRPLKNLISHG